MLPFECCYLGNIKLKETTVLKKTINMMLLIQMEKIQESLGAFSS